MKSLVGYSVIVLSIFVALLHPSQLESANLITTKDTLQTSRLSVNARVDSAGTLAGSSHVLIQTSASAPSNTITTNNLKAGDTLTIGASSEGYYTVVGIIDADEFTVSPVLASGDADNNDLILYKSKPRHVVTFNTATAIASGFFQILLPADTTTPDDGVPDDQGYDFGGAGAGTINVTATDVDDPAGGAVEYDFVTGISTASGTGTCTAPANYHCFEVHYSGTGAVNKTITINIGNTNGTFTPIAPATGTAHTEGTADTYPVLVKNFAAGANPNSASPTDATTVRLAHIEAVRVTATVDPTISLTIAGTTAGGTGCNGGTCCGVSTDVTTTALSVPFGGMALNTFKNLAQKLTVNTNAASGYVVTTSENDQLGRNGATTPNIADSIGNGGAMTESTFAEWTTSTVNGFGFSLQNVDAAVVPFQYTTATGACTGTFCARQFADIFGSETPQTIMSSTTVANAEDTFVCYRLGIGATQAAGDYENQITYIATGTF